MKVFICEDDPASLALTEIALENSFGLQNCLSASNGEAAWEALSNMKEAPDIILLDWNLPRVHGESLLERIRAHEDLATVPVIVVTTSISGSDNEAAETGGANDYIVKLPDFEAFQDSLKSAMERVLPH